MANEVELLRDFQEGLTGFVGTIDSDHAYIHDGIAFTAIANTGSISAAYYVGFKTPSVASGKFIHWRPIGITTSADYVEITLYEGDSYTSGTTVTPINRNRLATAITTNMQDFKAGVTSSPSGTIIQQTGIGSSGNPASRSGGGGGADEELVLKQDETYVIKIDPAGATIVNGSIFWYEETAGYDHG